MNHCMPRLFGRPDVFVFAAVVSLALMLQVRAAPPAGGAAAKDPNKGPVAELLAGTKANFEGSASCSNAQCHGAQAPNAPPKQAGNEFILWNGPKDPHRAAFKSLGAANAKGQQIWAAYQKMHPELANAQAANSEACISCHALSIPAARQGKNYKLTEGVTCDSCHGPSEKYVQPHAAPAWLPKQYEQFLAQNNNDPAKAHAAFLNQWGVYFNKPIAFRAQRCMSCHLEIDADMVTAGHPQPKFEMNWYTVTYADKHWTDPAGYFLANLWATGQAVAVRDAMKQLSDRAKNPAVKDKELEDAYRQAAAHWSVFAPIASSGAITVDPKTVQNMTAWAANLKASFGKKDKAAVAKAADALRAYAVQLAPAVDKWQPKKADAVKLLAAVGSIPPDGTPEGNLARDQQRLAMFALTNAIASSPEKPADAVAARGVIGQKLFPKDAQGFLDIEKIPPAQYTAAMQEVVPKLPK
jgi:hypothetical protein